MPIFRVLIKSLEYGGVIFSWCKDVFARRTHRIHSKGREDFYIEARGC